MNISVKARDFNLTVTNDEGTTVASVNYTNYEADIDLLGIIDAAGSVGDALRALQQRALGEASE